MYGATNALVKVAFSYAGFENAFNVVNEVKVGHAWIFRYAILISAESCQNVAMERAALPPARSNPIHARQHRLFLRRIKGRDPRLKGRGGEYLLPESLRHEQRVTSPEFLDLSQRIREPACRSYRAVPSPPRMRKVSQCHAWAEASPSLTRPDKESSRSPSSGPRPVHSARRLGPTR